VRPKYICTKMSYGLQAVSTPRGPIQTRKRAVCVGEYSERGGHKAAIYATDRQYYTDTHTEREIWRKIDTLVQQVE
jgi:hypothetical protein